MLDLDSNPDSSTTFDYNLDHDSTSNPSDSNPTFVSNSTSFISNSISRSDSNSDFKLSIQLQITLMFLVGCSRVTVGTIIGGIIASIVSGGIVPIVCAAGGIGQVVGTEYGERNFTEEYKEYDKEDIEDKRIGNSRI